jgi:hypothetical protein
MKSVGKLPVGSIVSAANAALVALVAIAVTACFETRVADPGKEGNSSETVALVGGKVVDADGHSVLGASVVLVPDDYNPIKGLPLPVGLTAVTDSRGEFAFRKVPKGRYGVEAIHPSDGTRLFTEGRELRDAKATLPDDTLRAPGKVRVRLPDYFKTPGGYLYIPHTRFAWPVTGTALEHGYLDLEPLPAANYAALAFSDDTDLAGSDTLDRGLDVLPGDTQALGVFAGWRHAGRIGINTAGAANFLGSNVTGFPMLVRLSAANFDFAAAAPDGSDLRFAKPDGLPMAFQIDHWDAVKREAAVWVALDTVRGNDSAQYFRMHWGKDGIASTSDGAAVFAGAGYAAAWHLEEETAGTGNAGVYRNSAANANHGIDSLSSTDQGGIIGNGHLFRDKEYIRMPNATAALKPPKAVTLSAWIKPTAADSDGAEIASMGNDYGIRVSGNGNAYMFNFNIPRTDSTNFLLVTNGINLVDGAWHHFAGILDGNHIEIYVDGVLARTGDFPAGVFRYDQGPDFFIGHHGNGETPFDYTGYIDEVRVMPGVSSDVLIRLIYLTQKPDASVLRMLP